MKITRTQIYFRTSFIIFSLVAPTCSSSATISGLQNDIRFYESKIEETHEDIVWYALSHIEATAAFIATGGAAAAFVDESLPPSAKIALGIAAIIGLDYCASNKLECTEVVLTMGSYFNTVSDYEAKISNLNKSIADLRDPGWKICNESGTKVHASIAYYEKEKWFTAGWYNVDNGECIKTLKQISSRYIYLYAKGPNGELWAGDNKLCANTENKFTYDLSQVTCPTWKVWSVDQPLNYMKIDTGESLKWTTTLKP